MPRPYVGMSALQLHVAALSNRLHQKPRPELGLRFQDGRCHTGPESPRVRSWEGSDQPGLVWRPFSVHAFFPFEALTCGECYETKNFQNSPTPFKISTCILFLTMKNSKVFLVLDVFSVLSKIKWKSSMFFHGMHLWSLILGQPRAQTKMLLTFWPHTHWSNAFEKWKGEKPLIYWNTFI